MEDSLGNISEEETAADAKTDKADADASAGEQHSAMDAQTEALFNEIVQPDPIPQDEVMTFLALREAAHARLFSAVPWLMPRFEALIGKYARGISIDLDAMEEQLRDAESSTPIHLQCGSTSPRWNARYPGAA